jgi:hypothetical protein
LTRRPARSYRRALAVVVLGVSAQFVAMPRWLVSALFAASMAWLALVARVPGHVEGNVLDSDPRETIT